MSMIWHKHYTVDFLQGFRNAHMGVHIGMEFTEIGDDFLRGRMPVDHRTTQPFGILHGGASCVLSETLGSVAAWMVIDHEQFSAVGLEINANHIRAVREGFVIGTCRPLHMGRTTHVWQTDITEESSGKRVCISRLTVAITPKGKVI
ncbi:MAG: hotdog fold thioesterase [Alphaproteobacteria bacterium]|nr:hotdog fold thioesterase [Alphaproteobacteria bacterium]